MPQITAVLTGIDRHSAASFMAGRTIVFISDECRFFMSFASFFMSFSSLLLTVDNGCAGLACGNAGAPDHVGAPDDIQAAGRAGTPNHIRAPDYIAARDK